MISTRCEVCSGACYNKSLICRNCKLQRFKHCRQCKEIFIYRKETCLYCSIYCSHKSYINKTHQAFKQEIIFYMNLRAIPRLYHEVHISINEHINDSIVLH